jgi:hypothetical protein
VETAHGFVGSQMRSGKFKEDFMRKILLGIIWLALFAMPVSAQTAED